MKFSYYGEYLRCVVWESESLQSFRAAGNLEKTTIDVSLLHTDEITSFTDLEISDKIRNEITGVYLPDNYPALYKFVAPRTISGRNTGCGFKAFDFFKYRLVVYDRNFLEYKSEGENLQNFVYVIDDSTNYIYPACIFIKDSKYYLNIVKVGTDFSPYHNDFVIESNIKDKLYKSNPLGHDVNIRLGESVTLEFSIKFANGTTENNVPVKFPVNDCIDTFGVLQYTIDGTTMTISNDCWMEFIYIKVTSVEHPELICNLTIHVLNPKEGPFPVPPIPPYLPEGGGVSGGGNQSTSSDVTGSFDGKPGPDITTQLPVGSSGSDVASSGMYTKYLCNNALLNTLAQFFWEDNVGIQALKAVLGNPIDSIISLTTYPFALDTLVPTTSTTIYFGQYDSHFSAFSLTKSSFQIDWGSVTIPFFWGSFLDYSPYTKIQLYLPWGVGFVSIDPNEVVPWSSKNSFNKADFVNGTIRVVTNIELDKGACVHNIIGNNGRIIGSFGGVVGKQVPVTGSDNSARILAMMSAAISSSAAVGMTAGGAVAAGKNLAYGKGMTMAERADGREMIGNYKSSIGGAIQSLSGGLASPPSYPRAGTFSDATNTLGYQYPYLIISRPSQSVPQQYGRFMGYPSNIFHNHLSELTGYTEVSSIHLDNIPATTTELNEIESILKGGVLL